MAKPLAYRHVHVVVMLLAVACLALLTAKGPHVPATKVLEVRAEDVTRDLRNQEAVLRSPLQLAAQYVTIDVSTLRWLWWPAIIYLFWGMAYVCDEYFVRTISIISDRFQIPDDVAGATLMALGCNGPEMALNTIAIFHPSNIGVGAVVGGEVFNVLVIIGTALLATPDMYMPLRLGRFTFFRDVIFYMLSVMLLYWVLKDGNVSRVNAVVLLIGAVVYTLVVTFSSQINKFFDKESKALRRTMTMTRKSLRVRLSLLNTPTPRNFDDPESSAHKLKDDSEEEEDEELELEVDPATLEQWDNSLKSWDPEEGTVLGVRVDFRNRLTDRNHKVDLRYMCLRADALVVSTLLDPRPNKRDIMRSNTGIVYDHNEHTQHQHWHHGGLVNQPIFLHEQEQATATKDVEAGTRQLSFSATPITQLSRPLLNETAKAKHGTGPRTQRKSPGPVLVPGFREAPWEVIPLEDILYCERAADTKSNFKLHVHQHDSTLGHLITLQLSAEDDTIMDVWVTMLQRKLLEQRRKSVEAPPVKGGLGLLMEWVEWLQFPVKFFTARTIPDMDDPKQKHLYPVAFTMSMVWLAIFAYSVVKACDGIHEHFGISEDILGFTVAAAGTSFPNVFSGMCVARQGKTSMAVANALGANVQNVFLALALPWTIQSVFLVGGPFPLAVDNLLPAVLACAITLLPVVMVYLCCKCSMPRWAGWLFLLTYAVYVVFALGQQISKCPIWPLACSA